MRKILERLHARINENLAEGKEIDHDAILTLCADLCAEPERIDREEALEVIALIEAITKSLIKGQGQVTARLRAVRRGRSALKGYNHLRATHTAQRLRRQG